MYCRNCGKQITLGKFIVGAILLVGGIAIAIIGGSILGG